MNIVLVSDTFAPDINGVARTLQTLARGLVARGHRVRVITTTKAAAKENWLHGVEVESVPSFPMPGYNHVRCGLATRRHFEMRMADFEPDAMYVAVESWMGMNAIRAAQRRGIRVVSGFHTNFHAYSQHYHLRLLKGAAERYLKWLHNATARTLTPSVQTAEQLRALGIRNVGILGRGVDTDLFTPARRDTALRDEWGASDDAPVALYVGRFAAEKNLPLAARAFELLVRQDPKARVVLVGEGPLEPWLRKTYPQFTFAGPRRGAELARHYASADIFVFSSSSETYGNVLPEALASGLVTVSFDQAAASQLIEHQHNGFIAPPCDEAAFLAEVEAAHLRWNDGSLRSAACETAKRLSWPAIAEQFEAELAGTSPATERAAAAIEDPAGPHLEAPPVPAGTARRIGTKLKPRFKTIFLSDIHLGVPECKAAQASHFLRNSLCEQLILNGDIIDGWALQGGGGRWTKAHTHFVRTVLRKMEKEGTEVIYLRGNHDEVMDRFISFRIANLRIAKEHIHESPHGRYLVVHGDGFDHVTTRYRWLAKTGAIGYDTLLWVNRLYNGYRQWRGKGPFSFARWAKARVKGAVSFVSRYEEQLQILARDRKCDGIICGHIHAPADERVGGIHYLNSGDWVESMTAIVEHLDRSFEVLTYDDWCRRTHRKPKGSPVAVRDAAAPAV